MEFLRTTMVGEPRDSGSSGGIFFLAAQACPDYCKAIDDSRCVRERIWIS
jgi:hypothetical protein